MLAKRIYPVAFLSILATSTYAGRDAVDNIPLLTAISMDPDLSIFYSLFNSTGGVSGTPGPQFEERFNNLTNRRDFTAFAPVNSVRSTATWLWPWWIANIYRLLRYCTQSLWQL
jgi:hypothetical protein